MRTYVLSEAARRTAMRQIVEIWAGIVLLYLLGNLILRYDRFTRELWLMGLLVLLIAALFIYILRQARTRLQSTRLRIDDQVIERRESKLPAVRIARDEVTAIYQTPEGLWVLSGEKGRTLVIPKGLACQTSADCDAEVYTRLAAWRPIEPLPLKLLLYNYLAASSLVILYIPLFEGRYPWMGLFLSLAFIPVLGLVLFNLDKIIGINEPWAQSIRLVLAGLLLIYLPLMAVRFGAQIW